MSANLPSHLGEHGGRTDYLTTDRIEADLEERAVRARTGASISAAMDTSQEADAVPDALVTLRAEAYRHLRKEDLLLGRLAVRTGRATEAQIQWALRMQDFARRMGDRLPSRLGEILVGSRVMHPAVLVELLELQATLRAAQPQGPV